MQRDSSRKNYYDILEVAYDAKEDDIKRAYKRLAVTAHPDKGGSAEKMAALSEARDILINPEKRRIYDLTGDVDGSDFGDIGAARMARDFFRAFFEGDIGFDARSQESYSQHMGKSPASFTTCKITLRDICCGISKKYNVTRRIICDCCKGYGYPKNSELTICDSCEGQGFIMVSVKGTMDLIKQMAPCPKCRGIGGSEDTKNACKKCSGSGIKNITELININIPAGMENGNTIIMEGAGDHLPNCYPGDLNFIIEEIPHETFKHERNNLRMTLCISLLEALCGFERSIIHPDGRSITFQYNKIVNFGDILYLPGEGVTITNTTMRGDLLIDFKISMPKQIEERNHIRLKRIFGQDQQKINISDNEQIKKLIVFSSDNNVNT